MNLWLMLRRISSVQRPLRISVYICRTLLVQKGSADAFVIRCWGVKIAG